MEDYNLEHLNVLLVEDNPHMQTLLKEILRSFRIKNVRGTSDGEEALEAMQTFATDLVIADWAMQPMDGLEFVRQLRTSNESANPYVPVIMLTGHTETHRVFEARDSGITEFLAKPVSAKGLYHRICMVIERPRQFIKTETYTGPDRRRTKPTPTTNKGRRASDKAKAETEEDGGEVAEDEIPPT